MDKELVDVVDETDKIVGKESRKACHVKGLWHRVSAILIFNSEGKLYLQKRAKGIIGEGLLDYSASGHVISEESYKDAAHKELREELGIKTELKLLYKKLLEVFNYHDRFKIRHIIRVYTGKYNGKFKIQESELENIKLYDLKYLKKDIMRNPEIMTEGLNLCLQKYIK